MKTVKYLIKRYRFFLIMAAVVGILTAINTQMGLKALSISGNQLLRMLLIMPPIFILLGLLDVWVPRETMVRFMGEGSGVKGIALAFLIGSVSAGPLYGAFPVAAVLMKKGAKFTNILIFIGAWSTTKVTMFLFEMSSLGVKFALTRLLVDIPGIILMSYLLSKLIPAREKERIYQMAEAMDGAQAPGKKQG